MALFDRAFQVSLEGSYAPRSRPFARIEESPESGPSFFSVSPGCVLPAYNEARLWNLIRPRAIRPVWRWA